MVQTLTGIAMTGESEAARVSAAIHILNRGWGMPDQPHTATVDANIEIVIRNIIRGEPKTIEGVVKRLSSDGDNDE